MKLIEKFKSIMPHVTVLMAEDIDLVSKYIPIGDLNQIDKIFSQKKFRVISLPIKSLFHQAFCSNRINIIEYFLTSEHTKEFHNTNLNGSFMASCANGKRDFIESIFKSHIIRKNVDLYNLENNCLMSAASSRNFNAIEFFIHEHTIKNKLELNARDDLLFKQLFREGNKDMLQYLIVELSMKFTPSIKLFIEQNYANTNSKLYLKMFETRDLKTELEAAPSANLTVVKKRLKV